MTPEQTLIQLKKKDEDYKVRMPSIKSIHELLDFYKIKHSYSESQNIVEYRSKGMRYVNSRHEGQKGKKIEITGYGSYIDLDTSDSYYSINASSNAGKIVRLIEQQINQQKTQ